MRSNTTRIALAVSAIAALAVLFVVLNGGSDNSKSTTTGTAGKPSSTTQAAAPQPPSVVTVRGGKPVGGVQQLSYRKGDQVRFRVDSDVADEIHVHGYDFKKDVPAGGKISFDFPATISGSFEIELEGRKEQIAALEVQP